MLISLLISMTFPLMQYAVGTDCNSFNLWKAFNPTLNCSQAITWNCRKVQNSTIFTQLQCNNSGLTTVFPKPTYTWVNLNVSYAVTADGNCYLDPLTNTGFKSNCSAVEQCPACTNCRLVSAIGNCIQGIQESSGNKVGWGLFK